MKRLKQLRECANYTQGQLAKMLKVSQQTIARWESGKSEPHIAALRDLALIFGTSVDELLAYEKTGKKPSTNCYCLFNNELDGYWGDIGLKIGGKPSIWFPISAKTMNRVSNQLEALDNEEDWLAFPTLNNKYVVCRPTTIERMTFLDEASDGPCNDGELMQAMAPELYPAFNILSSLYNVNWNQVREILLGLNKDNISSKSNKQFWKALIEKVTPYFNEEASETFIKTVIETFVESSFDDDEKFIKHMCEINIYYNDGSVEGFLSDVDDIDSFMFGLDIDDDVKMINFTSFSEADVFIPLSKISAVVMPYTDVLEWERKAVAEETEEEVRQEGGDDE